MQRSWTSLPFLVAVLAASPALAANVEVLVSSYQFTPSLVTIQVGDSVTWRNVEGSHDVVADDGSFFGGDTSANNWTFTHTFNSPGSFGYYCSPHINFGMQGMVVVQGGSNSNPGVIQLDRASYTVNEGGSVTVRVNRLTGDDGAVSVGYTTSAGSAGAGDFTAVSGTLTWPDGNDDPRTFTVAAAQDSLDEPIEFFTIQLGAATGGAILHTQRSATVNILDDDGAPTGPPAAPGNLQAIAHSTTEMMLSWSDTVGETGYRIERKTFGGTYQEVGTAPADATGFHVSGLTPATLYLFRVRAAGSGNFSLYSNEASAATRTTPAPCVAGPNTLCLNDNRFQAEVSWKIPSASGEGTAVPLAFAPDSGLFYFFNPSNIEMLIKVLDACVEPFNHYWVFYAATTDVELTLTVIDTQTGFVKVYTNTFGQKAAPVQDTVAFATCP